MTTKKQTMIDETLIVIRSYTTRLTLRQIYYRLVSRGVLKNSITEYKALSSALVDARLNGQIPWDSIEDRTREFSAGDAAHIPGADYFADQLKRFKEMATNYRFPLWWFQPTLVEVWAEKQALEALFSQVCRAKRVTLGVCRGYPSITFLHDAASRLEEALSEAVYDRGADIEKIVILYFGDHDPSGCDIERNVTDRLTQTFNIELEVRRIAITEDQIAKYNIPPMPTKTSDSRARAHIAKYGAVSSVELDAIDPNVLQKLIAQAIQTEFDNGDEIKVQLGTDLAAEIDAINEGLKGVLKEE